MNGIATDHRTHDGRSPTNVWRLRNPLDLIAGDHLRLRTICAEIDGLVQSPAITANATAALTLYLSQELPLLLADEDEELMPRLLRRAEPEDELPKLAKRLGEEHREISGHLRAVLSGLEGLSDGGALPPALGAAMQTLAKATRRHLILENAVLLPLARARLTGGDLRSLRRAMLERRGLEDPFAEQP